jgi:hypothetical protein
MKERKKKGKGGQEERERKGRGNKRRIKGGKEGKDGKTFMQYLVLTLTIGGLSFVMHIFDPILQFSFVTCNRGEGSQYHPSSASLCANSKEGAESTAPKLKYRASVKIDNIPGEKMLDSSFWMMLLSQFMKGEPCEYHRVEVVYDVLLPWLMDTTCGLLPDGLNKADSDPYVPSFLPSFLSFIIFPSFLPSFLPSIVPSFTV